MSRLSALTIDDATWDRAESSRREEWRLAITELLGDPEQQFLDGAHRLAITVSGQSTFFELRDSNEHSMARVEVPRSELTEHITEYVDIVRQIARADEGLGSARVEALDMAKRVAHDSAARTLQRQLETLSPNHATCRRLWTLVLSLRVDTTRLTGVRGHRPVR